MCPYFFFLFVCLVEFCRHWASKSKDLLPDDLSSQARSFTIAKEDSPGSFDILFFKLSIPV